MNDSSYPTPDDAPPASSADTCGGASGDSIFVVIRGRGGLLDGEFVKVLLGATVTLGRSRRCEFSLKKSARYLLSAGSDRSAIRSGIAYRAVSRRHCSVTLVSPTVVEIVNHSRNGTLVDGRPVTRLRLDDIQRTAHELQLGRNGDRFDVEYGSLALLPEESISN